MNVAAYVEGEIMSELMRRCGADLSRENLMKQASNFSGAAIPRSAKDVVLRTDPDTTICSGDPELIRWVAGEELNRAAEVIRKSGRQLPKSHSPR